MSGTIRAVEPSVGPRGDGPLLVGIDLGTSRSAICASNGRKAAVASYVGWPVDAVAHRVLAKDIVVGSEAVEHRSMLEVHRPLERGLIKQGSQREVIAAREIVKALLAAVRSSESTPVRAVVGVPAEALRVNRRELRSALEGLFERLMIVSEPFAVGYGIEALVHALVVDIGAGTTDLCLMRGRYPVEGDQKTLAVAGDSLDEHLLRLVRERYPHAAISVHMIRRWKEESASVGGDVEAVLVEAPVEGRPTSFDIGAELRTACEAILPPVTETLFELLARAEPDFQKRVRNSIVLAGGTSLIRGLGPEIEKALAEVGGGRVTSVADPQYAGSEGALALAVDATAEEWEQLPIAVSA